MDIVSANDYLSYLIVFNEQNAGCELHSILQRLNFRNFNIKES